MARPARNALPGNILSSARTFFVTTKTSQGRALLQSERNATLMIDVLRSYVAARKFRLHDFVVMPDHLHLLVTVGDGMTVERAMQLVKGILIPLEEGMRSFGRGLAAWLLRDARGVSAELHQASGIHSGEPGEGGTGREARGVPLLFHVPGREEGSGG